MHILLILTPCIKVKMFGTMITRTELFPNFGRKVGGGCTQCIWDDTKGEPNIVVAIFFF